MNEQRIYQYFGDSLSLFSNETAGGAIPNHREFKIKKGEKKKGGA